MRLPNPESAVIDERKLRDYLLSADHPVGRFKAAFFRRLGFSSEHAELLRVALLAIPSRNDVAHQEATDHGRKYLVRGILTGPRGVSAEVVEVWLVPTGADRPHLVTVYPR
jgi:hypothetical protein